MKNFDEWNEKKKNIEKEIKDNVSIREREICWLCLGLNIGDEQDGKNENFERPVLILKKFNNKIAWVLPMSTQPGHPKYYIKIFYENKESYVILSQLRLISVKRLDRKIGELSFTQFREIKNKIVSFLK